MDTAMQAAESDSDNQIGSELSRLFGHDDFRSGQREIVEAAVNGVDTLAVMPTGGGKSLTYQLPAMLVSGATLVLSPLIALMKDQAENLPPEVAAKSTIINSSLDGSEVGKRLAMVKAGRIKMVYAAPERLRQPPFLHALRRANVSLVVVDEAHCISQWGHDFRPDYRAVGKAVESLNPRSVLAVTATATPEVQSDIEKQLGRPLQRIVRPTYRDNLFLECRKVAGEDEKLWATLDICKNTPGAGLVYAGSREKCEQLSRMLVRQGIKAGFYHAGLPPQERAAAQDRFMAGDVRVMAATVAFGMGVDKSDIRFLVHYNPSRTLENYYQEAGRAGRDGAISRCTLLYSSGDAASATRHLREDTLTLDHIKMVYNAVRQAVGRKRVGPVAFGDLVQAAGGDEGLVRAALPLLEEAGLLARYVDIPRSVTVYPDPYAEDGGEEVPDGWDDFARAVGPGGDFDPSRLSQETGVALPDLEETILRYQDAGRLTYRSAPREFLLEILPPPPDTKARMESTLQHRSRGAQERITAMQAYAKDVKCRHASIARYFGDRWPNVLCGSCDVCAALAAKRGGNVGPPARTRDEAKQVARRGGGDDEFSGRVIGGRNGGSETSERGENLVDPAQAPLMALQVIHDLAQGYNPWAIGKTGLLRTLRGTPDSPIKPNRTRAFGALGGMKKGDVDKLIEALIEANFLRRDEEDEYRKLYLTDTGREGVTSGSLDFDWRYTAPREPSEKNAAYKTSKAIKAAAADEPMGDIDDALLTTLKAWRRDLAAEENVPNYLIFADTVLQALAARKPSNEFDLLEIRGIGPKNAAKYGENVLDIIRRHENG